MPVAVVLAAEAAIVVDAEEAARLVADPRTAVLDARDLPPYLLGHIPGAPRTDWRVGTDPDVRGKIRDPLAMADHYAALGVSADAPVLVVGGWVGAHGEEGRVAWNLIWLGHPDVHVLRGGMQAWRGGTEVLTRRPPRGDFTAAPLMGIRVDARSLANDPEGYTLLDVRRPEEFEGITPEGELATHIPGAINVPWTTLVDAVPEFARDKPLVVYCSSGLRSSLAWVLLTDAGYAVANFDGSWWEWEELYGAR